MDDILTRGHRKTTASFWAAVAENFAVTHWDIVGNKNPLVFCAKRISKIRKDKEVWYTVNQTEDIRVFLDESGMTGARAQHAPMPDKHEISSD